nr:PREDICTED: transmembrane protein 68 isoform X3 [Linepithema humile]
MFSIVYNIWPMLEDIIVEYTDVDFTWLSWLLMPLIVTFLLPLVIVLLFYLTSLILYVYKLHRVRLRTAYGTAWRDAARYTTAAIWDAHGWIWHVADRFLFNVPGWSIILDVLKVIPGTIQTCSAVLKEGNMLAISPGGVYEAQFGNSYYKLMWKKRMGFAKVALDAKVSIIPIFTKNIREAFRTISWGRRIWLKIYSWTKVPFVPIYGGFPVKLITYVGKPIPYDGNLTPEELQIKVADALKNLINEHQRIPGNITWALIERMYKTRS